MEYGANWWPMYSGQRIQGQSGILWNIRDLSIILWRYGLLLLPLLDITAANTIADHGNTPVDSI